MHPRTLEELGWPEIRSALAQRCRLPAGRERALTLPFLPDAAAVVFLSADSGWATLQLSR